MSVQAIADDLIDPESAPITSEERILLAQVEEAHENGLELKRWWDQATDRWQGVLNDDRLAAMLEAGVFRQHFRLMQKSSGTRDLSYGVFDEVRIKNRMHPVMGVVQQMFFDRPRGEAVAAPARGKFLEIWRDNLCEFALGYFLRFSATRRPAPYVGEGQRDVASYLRSVSWCPEPEGTEEGLAYSQLYYKRQDNGRVGKFRLPDQGRVDLRLLGQEKGFAWIVIRVRVYGYGRELKLAGELAPSLTLPLEAEGLGIVASDLIVHEDGPRQGETGVLGRYGLGYTWLMDTREGEPIPEHQPSDAAFKRFDFRVEDDGNIFARVTSVWCRPRRVFELPLNPLTLGLRLADLMSLGLFSPLLDPLKRAVRPLAAGLGFDPVLAYVNAANVLTGGAAQRLCISRDELDRQTLREHFQRNRDTMHSARGVWRRYGDWTREDKLPRWIVEGLQP